MNFLLFALIVPTLFAARSLKLTCGTCSANVTNCKSVICIKYTGEEFFEEACIDSSQCPFSNEVNVKVSSCNVDYFGDACRTKTCFNGKNLTVVLPFPLTCTKATVNFTSTCKSTPNCEQFLDLISTTLEGSTLIKGGNSTCLSSRQDKASCPFQGEVQATVARSPCGGKPDSFGVTGECCFTAIELTDDFKLCTSVTPWLSHVQVEKNLAVWASKMEKMVVVAAMMILASWMI